MKTRLVCPRCGETEHFSSDNGRVICDVCLARGHYVMVVEKRDD